MNTTMIDISKATYNGDRWDNDERRETEIYCSLPEDMAADLCRGRFRELFASALKRDKHIEDVMAVKPYAEIQMRCPWGEEFFDLGSATLAIGMEDETSIEELEIIDLIPNRDFEESAAWKLWDAALKADAEKNKMSISGRKILETFLAINRGGRQIDRANLEKVEQLLRQEEEKDLEFSDNEEDMER